MKLIGKAKARRRKAARVAKSWQHTRRATSVLDVLVKYGDSPLDVVCTDVSPSDNRGFIDTMERVLRYSKNGVGLAANQIGATKRVCVVITSGGTRDMVVMINPTLLDHESATVVASEGCLSYPKVFVNVERRIEVKVRYLNEQFAPVEKTYWGMTARIIQHEIDHLDGHCVVGDAWRAAEASQ